jgi:hypothetical protein
MNKQHLDGRPREKYSIPPITRFADLLRSRHKRAHINQFCVRSPIYPEAITAVQDGSSGAFQFDAHCLPYSLLVCLFPGVQPRKWPMRRPIT